MTLLSGAGSAAAIVPIHRTLAKFAQVREVCGEMDDAVGVSSASAVDDIESCREH